MKKYRIDEITDNLDNLRKPLNNIERGKISKNKLYPYYGANNLMDYVDDYIFDEEILCVAEDGGSWGYREKCSYIVNEKCWVNNHAHVLRAKENLNIKYLSYYLNYNDLSSSITGTTRGKLTKSALSRIEVLLPELEKQNAMGEILDKAQDLINKRKEQIEALDELVKSKFIEMFGNPSKNEKGWEISEIGKYLEVLTDYHSNGSYETLRDNVTLLDTPSYALMVRTTDLENNNFENDVKYIDEHAYNHLEKSKIFGGEIIINKIGSAGKVYLMPYLNRPVSLAMNQFLLRFNQEKVNHIFLYNLLLTPYMESKIKEKVRGAVTKTITKDAVREVSVIVPPIELQNKFVEFVNQLDKMKLKMEKSLKELEDNFNSLMQKAFKGDLF